MNTRILICVSAAFVLNVVAAAEKKINYAEHVRPILRDKCFSCHNTNKKSANLDLSTYTSLMQGGASGEVIEAGSAENSYLFMLITHESEPTMPPESDRIPDPMLDTIRQWIDSGAPQTSSSKVMLPTKPKIDLNVSASAVDRPEGPPPLPDVLNLEPVVHSNETTAVSAIATSPWAPVVAVAGQKQVVLYNTQTLQICGVLPFSAGQIRVLKFSRDGALLLAGGGRGGSKGLAVVWDVRTGEQLFEVGDELDEVLAADISADYEFVALSGPQKIVRVYDTVTGELAWETTKHTDWVTSLEFSPDTVLLATGDRTGGLHVWETFTGRHYSALPGHKNQVNAVSWRIDSNVLASASRDASIKLWEMEGGQNIKSWNGHGGGTTCVEFCRDGQLVSCGRDKVAKMWDQNGKQLLAFEGFSDIALRASHCDETNRVIAGDWTGLIRAWSAADGKRVAELTSNPPMLASRLASAEAALPPAMDAQTKARAALEQITAQHKNETDKLTAAQAMLKTAQKVIAALQQDKTSQELALAEAKAKRDQQQKDLATLKAALPRLKTAADSAKAAADALPEDEEIAEAATRLTASLKSRTENAATLKTESEVSQKNVASRKATLKEVIANLQKNEKLSADSDAILKTSTAALDPLSKTLAESQRAAAAADGAVQKIQSNLGRWKQYIALRDELSALEVSRTHKDQQQLAMLEAELALNEHQKTIGESEARMASHQKTMTDQQKVITDLQTRITATLKQEQQQQDQATKHTQAIPVLKMSLQQAKVALALLPEDAAIQASVDSLAAAIVAKKEALFGLQAAVVKAQESLQADNAAMVTANQAITSAQEQHAAEQNFFAGLQTAREPLSATLSATTMEFESAETQVAEAIEVVEARRAQLRQATEVTQVSVSP